MFKTVTILLLLTSGFNVYTTGVARRQLGNDFRDLSPFARNQTMLTGSVLLIDLGEMRLAWKERKAGNRSWWVLPTLTSIGHVVVSQHNLKVSRTVK